MSDKPQKQATANNFQHQYLAKLLVNVYSYCLMVKKVSCCCVRGSRLFSNLVTFNGAEQLIEVEIGGSIATLTAELPVGSKKAYGLE